MTMPHRTVRGRIRYTSKKPERMDAERGREWFHFTHHADGSTVMSAHCEIEEPDPVVMRDVVLTIDSQGRARNFHVNLVVGDAPMGSGWFDLDYRDGAGGSVTCESNSRTLGRVSQRVDFDHRPDGFGTHPIVGDGYMTRCIDVSMGPHRRAIRVFVPSPDHRGASPPLISEVTIDLEYLCDETVTVPAGTFACHKFAFIDDSDTGMGGKTHPRYEMWVTADEDHIFVQGGVGGYMATWYELIELERS